MSLRGPRSDGVRRRRQHGATVAIARRAHTVSFIADEHQRVGTPPRTCLLPSACQTVSAPVRSFSPRGTSHGDRSWCRQSVVHPSPPRRVRVDHSLVAQEPATFAGEPERGRMARHCSVQYQGWGSQQHQSCARRWPDANSVATT